MIRYTNQRDEPVAVVGTAVVPGGILRYRDRPQYENIYSYTRQLPSPMITRLADHEMTPDLRDCIRGVVRRSEV